MKLYCLQKRSITAFSTYYTKGFSILVLGLLSYCSLQAQTITAKQRDVIIIDNGAPGKADPGDRIMYDVTISNSGATQGNNTQLNINPDPRTTFIPGSFKSSPLALDDNYNATGNIGITISAGSGVLLNDFDDNIPGLTVTAGTFATTQGGSIDMAANGSFSYKPKAGFIGSDQFVYTLNDSDPVGPPVPATNTGTISFTVSQMVWFIDNSASLSANTGTFSDPFKTIGAFNTANTGAALKPQDNDLISLRRGTGTYAEADGINLRLGQRLIGEAVQFNTVFTADVNSLSAYQTFASGTMASPVIAASAGNGVDLLSGNTLRGFNIGNCSGMGINGLAFGTLTINTISINSTGQAMTLINGTIAGTGFSSVSSSGGVNNISLGALSGSLALGSGALSGATGGSFVASQGTATVTYSGTINKTTGTRMIDIQNLTGGSYTFSGALIHNLASGSQESIFLNMNGSANITFSGGLSLTSVSTGAVFSATTGGIVTVTGTNNEILSTVGTGLNLQSTNASGSGITFALIACTTGQVANINSSTGTKTLGHIITSSGGTAALSLINGGIVNAGDPSTSTLTTSTGTGILINTTTLNLTGSGVLINATGNGIGLNMTGGIVNITGGLFIGTNNGVGFNASSGGTVSLTGSGNVINSSAGIALNVVNTNIGASNLNFVAIFSNASTNGIILNSTGTSGGLVVTGDGGGSNNGSGGTIQNTTAEGIKITSSKNINLGYMNLTNFGTDGINAISADGFSLNRCNISDNAGNNTIDDGITLTNASGAVSITNSSFIGSRHQGITVDNFNVNMTSLTISNTTVSNTPGGDGILIQMRGTSTMTTGTISNNTISSNSATGLQVNNADTGNILNLNVQGNTVDGNNAGMDFDVSQAASMTVVAQTNIVTHSHSQAINSVASTSSTGGTLTVTIKNNNIGIAGDFDSGSAIGGGIRIANGGTNVNLTIDGNVIREVPNARGIDIEPQAYIPNLNVKVKIVNNTIVRPTGTNQSIGCGFHVPCPSASIFVLSDNNNVGGFDHVCMSISGNVAYDPTSWPSGGEAAYYFARRTTTSNTMTLEGNTVLTPKQNILNNNMVTNFTAADFVDEGAPTMPVIVVAVGACGGFP